MQFSKRLGLAIATIAFVGIAPALSVQAQTQTPTVIPNPITFQPLICTLSAADCKLVDTAQANTALETSFLQAFNFKMVIAGNNPLTIQANGTGAFSIDPKVNIKDQSALIHAIQFQLDLTGSSIGAFRQAGKVGLVLKDGVEYGQFTNNNAPASPWVGIDLYKYMTGIQQTQQSASNQQLQQAAKALAADPDMRAALAAIPNIKGFITQKRLPNDAVLEGQRMAQIQYTYDFQPLFASPDFAKVVSGFTKALSDASPPGTQGLQGLQQFNNMNDVQRQGLLMLVGGVFAKTNMTFVRWIGESDKLTHALNFVINLNIVASSFNTGSQAAVSSKFSATINFSVQVTKIGKPVTVTAPKGATLITPQQLRQGLGANSGGINQ